MRPIQIAAVLLAGTFAAAADQSQYNTPYCSNQMTAGTWMVSCSGFVTPAANATPVPMTLLGTAQADEAGLFTGISTNSIGGTVFSQKVSGQANTKTDCTGSITYNKGQTDELNIVYVVAANGDKITGMVINPGANVTCQLTRIRR